MSYPKRLLPDKYFKRISWHNDLNNQYLIRRTDNTDFIDIDGRIKSTSLASRTDHLRDFSTNMLGVFQVDDIYIEIIGPRKDYFTSNWEERESVLIPIINQDFHVNRLKGYYFFNIGDLNDVELSVYDDVTAVQPHCFVLHTPTKCNFWHFSLRWFFKGEDILTWTPSERRRILSSAKSFLIEKAIIQEPIFQELNTIHYFN